MPPGTHALTAQDVDAWLDGYMPFALRSGDIAGAVVVVIKDGQVLSSHGYGYADIAKRTPVDPARTLFRIGSVSKLFTWTAVMQQVEQGKIDLDADVNRYLDFKIPPYQGQPITMRQIMTHTSGFEEVAKNDFVSGPAQIRPLETFIKAYTPHRIYPAGTTPAYSNWATMLAGYIVQRVSGMPFDDYIEQHIYAPLGMKYASFRQPLPPAIAPYMATGYSRASGPAKPFEWVQVTAAGSMAVSGLDIAKFMIAHLENGRGILKPETAAVMHNSPLSKVNPRSIIPPLNRMELGFFETNVNGHEVIGHLGDIENMHTSLHLMTGDGVGFFVSFNSAGREGAAHPLRVNLFQDFADRYFPSTQHDGRVDAKTAAQHAQMLTGLWEGSRRVQSKWMSAIYVLAQTKVGLDAQGRLSIPALKGAGGAPRTWTEIAPFVWREVNGHERLAAQVVDGRAVRWSVDGESPFTVFDRVPASRSSAWLLPALYVSLVVLALTFLYWPATWFVRRRYKARHSVEGEALHVYRATRIMAGLDVAVILGWVAFVSTVAASATLLTSVTDPWLWLLQILSVIVFPGAFGAAAWNAWLTWRDGRRWTRKTWSVLILLATFVLLYFAVGFHFIGLTGNY
ncbi:serine hydrolase domain-containing protein [Sphingomonas sp. CROZ-RG-20F-R02-07]|uniref:serine hydrolase domain-containing protein n=1 Tax=Sphingomonas sp. CROZ-RG-20F-R02-07 TaxID=2914832 RepID=UPI001F562B4F|nr:serine hydrolase domain-containing protein [Sphingomonas sp. CROZ-RG-20F-R02-07]